MLNMFFLCRQYVTGHSRDQTRTHKNCKKFFLFSWIVSGQEDDDFKDGLSEIPFPSQRTQMTSHEVRTDWLALIEPNSCQDKCYTHDC